MNDASAHDARQPDATDSDGGVTDAAVTDAGASDSGTGTTDPAQRARNAYLRWRLEAHRAAAGIPGMGAALVVDGDIAAAGVVGVRSVATNEAVQLNDAFMVKSCTKPMTGHLVARIIQLAPPIAPGSPETFSWDTRILDVFPELSSVTHPAYVDTNVRDLMSHTSRMPSQPLTEPADEFASVSDDLRERRFLYVQAAVQDAPVDPSPYGGGSIVVAAMLERVMDQTWEQLMRTYVFDELGMTNSGFGEHPYPPLRQAVSSHTMSAGGPQVWMPPSTYAEEVHAPAGRNPHASVPDVARFVAAQLPDAMQRPGMLSRALLLQAQEQIPDTDDTWGGWAVTNAPWNNALSVRWHNGADGKDFCLMVVSPSESLATVVMSNYEDEPSAWDMSQELRPIATYYEMASAFDATAAAPKSATATDEYTPLTGYDANKAVDGLLSTRWATNDGVHTASLTIDLGAARSIQQVHIAEAAEYQRVQAFTVSVPRMGDAGSEAWEVIGSGTTIGPHAVVTFAPVVTSSLRVSITDANGSPTLVEVWAK